MLTCAVKSAENLLSSRKNLLSEITGFFLFSSKAFIQQERVADRHEKVFFFCFESPTGLSLLLSDSAAVGAHFS